MLFKVTSGTYTGWACLLVPVTWCAVFHFLDLFFAVVCFVFVFCFSFAVMSYCSLPSVP